MAARTLLEMLLVLMYIMTRIHLPSGDTSRGTLCRVACGLSGGLGRAGGLARHVCIESTRGRLSRSGTGLRLSEWTREDDNC